MNPMQKQSRAHSCLRWGPLLAITLVVLSSCRSTADFRREVVEARNQARDAFATRGAGEGPVEWVVLRGPLSLRDAIEMALQNNKALAKAQKELQVARGKVLESYTAALPSLLASAGYTRLDDINRIEIGPQSLEMGSLNNYSVQLTARQPLFHGEAIPAALRVAKWYALWAEEAVRSASQQIIFQTTRAYYDLLLAEVLVDVYSQTWSFASALLEDVKTKRKEGVASDYDVLRAEVEVSNAKAEWIRHSSERDLARARLLNAMGVSPISDVTLTGSLRYTPLRASVTDAVSRALSARPELLQAEYAVRMQEEAVRIARSQYWPRLDAFGSQEWARPDPHSALRDEWGDAWRAGVSASLPIFDGMARRGKLLQERARWEQSKLDLREKEQGVALEAQQAVLALVSADEMVLSQRLNLERATEGLRLVQVGYREGTRTEVEVLDAQTALTRARAFYYQALHAHSTARLAYWRAVGELTTDRFEELLEPVINEDSKDETEREN